MSASPIDIHPNWFRGTRTPPPERPTFGAFVRRLRSERAASQEAFAEAVGLERRTIADRERDDDGLIYYREPDPDDPGEIGEVA